LLDFQFIVFLLILLGMTHDAILTSDLEI